MRPREIRLGISEAGPLFFVWRTFRFGCGETRGWHPLCGHLLHQYFTIEIRVVLICEPRDLHTVILFVFAWELGTQSLPRVCRHQSFTVKGYTLYYILCTIA